jgi:hypothetical protein
VSSDPHSSQKFAAAGDSASTKVPKFNFEIKLRCSTKLY